MIVDGMLLIWYGFLLIVDSLFDDVVWMFADSVLIFAYFQ